MSGMVEPNKTPASPTNERKRVKWRVPAAVFVISNIACVAAFIPRALTVRISGPNADVHLPGNAIFIPMAFVWVNFLAALSCSLIAVGLRSRGLIFPVTLGVLALAAFGAIGVFICIGLLGSRI